MIGSFAVFGMMVGATAGGKLISIGRHRVLDLAAVVGVVGVALTLV